MSVIQRVVRSNEPPTASIAAFLDNMTEVSTTLLDFYDTKECNDIDDEHGKGIWGDFHIALTKLEKQHMTIVRLLHDEMVKVRQ